MDSNNIINGKSKSTPFWKVICGVVITYFLNLIISLLVYALWISLSLPDFSYLWLIMFVLIYVLSSNVLERNYGTTIGNIILRIKPSIEQTRKATRHFNLILSGIAIIIIIVANFFRSTNSDKVIENDYYEITIPGDWHAMQITEKNPVLYSIAIGKDQEKIAWLNTVNYNISGLSFDALTGLVLGGLDRNDISDVEFKETKYQDCEATEINGVINGVQLRIIVFLAPSGKLSYIMAQNMSRQEFGNLLLKVHLKDTQSSFADFDDVWKEYSGDNLEWNINQEIEEGLILEGWKYNKLTNTIYMNLILDADDDAIKTYFNDEENRDNFINVIMENQMLIQIAKNYNKSALITIKNNSGDIILSLPAK